MRRSRGECLILETPAVYKRRRTATSAANSICSRPRDPLPAPKPHAAEGATVGPPRHRSGRRSAFSVGQRYDAGLTAQ